MIVTKNPGKRTSKTSESRQIFINSRNYIAEEQEVDNKPLKLIEQLKKEESCTIHIEMYRCK